jgi:hypothetical protein
MKYLYNIEKLSLKKNFTLFTLTNPPFLSIIILGMFSHTSVIRQAGDLKYAQIYCTIGLTSIQECEIAQCHSTKRILAIN